MHISFQEENGNSGLERHNPNEEAATIAGTE